MARRLVDRTAGARIPRLIAIALTSIGHEALRQFPAGRVVMVDEFRTKTGFYGRDVTAALNIRRCARGPGPRPTELC
ncbi:hypothetical protein QJQ45_027886 [Haematococcus lacustris]|nr:hypothetical protein QJQ45_027886 [Haematococcus lacustris]